MNSGEPDADGVAVWETRDGAYMISDGGGWFPGVYDSEAAARAALAIGETPTFMVMQKRVNYHHQEDRLITQADLDALPTDRQG